MQDAVDITLDPARTTVPVAAGNVRRKRRDLEIVLNVDGQGIGDHFTAHFDHSLFDSDETSNWGTTALLLTAKRHQAWPSLSADVPEWN